MQLAWEIRVAPRPEHSVSRTSQTLRSREVGRGLGPGSWQKLSSRRQESNSPVACALSGMCWQAWAGKRRAVCSASTEGRTEGSTLVQQRQVVLWASQMSTSFLSWGQKFLSTVGPLEGVSVRTPRVHDQLVTWGLWGITLLNKLTAVWGKKCSAWQVSQVCWLFVLCIKLWKECVAFF